LCLPLELLDFSFFSDVKLAYAIFSAPRHIPANNRRFIHFSVDQLPILYIEHKYLRYQLLSTLSSIGTSLPTMHQNNNIAIKSLHSSLKYIDKQAGAGRAHLLLVMFFKKINDGSILV
jgi:hypothetical protein